VLSLDSIYEPLGIFALFAVIIQSAGPALSRHPAARIAHHLLNNVKELANSIPQ